MTAVEAIKAAFLGLVQGITEFFPVSSSAHLLALRHVLGFKVEGLAFDVALHFATLLAVIIYFRREIAMVLKSAQRWPVFVRLVVAMLPSVAAGLLFAKARENLHPAYAVAGWTFSGAYLLSLRHRRGTKAYADAPMGTALGIGFAQALAIFPGVSRSGATITAGVWLGLEREQAARFSFLLSIPAIFGAGVFEARHFLSGTQVEGDFLAATVCAMPVAFLVGLGAIHLLLRIVRADVFHRFGWYNLLAALAFGVYLLLEG